MRAEAGRTLPDYIEQEFDAYLKCGRLEEGFLRVRCETCHAEKLVAFSCKKRGSCPSCAARRMAETAALLVGAGLWVKDALFSINPGKGTAIGPSVRTDRHVATLIQALEPYVPSLDRNAGDDTYSISLFLVPLDGSSTHLIPLGVDLAAYELRPEAEVSNVDPRALPRPWGDSPLAPRPEHFLRAVGESEYLDAAFLRASNTSTPIRLDGPPGTLMLYTSMPGPQGTAVVARVDDAGKLLWRADTGISRFALQQILPGTDSTAFVGPRPPVPDKVSEPRLVIIEHDSGRQVTHSLWR
jgi:ribosomal protein S27E